MTRPYTTKTRGTNSKRMELKVRTVEGQGGNIALYVIAAHEKEDTSSIMKIGQTAQCVSVEVPPSLHCRSETPKYPIHKLPLNVLEIKKYASLNQIHEWLRNILRLFPGAPCLLIQSMRCIVMKIPLWGRFLLSNILKIEAIIVGLYINNFYTEGKYQHVDHEIQRPFKYRSKSMKPL